MNKLIATIVIFSFSFVSLQAQKYFSKTGEISFHSSTPIEDIEAISNSASTVFDLESGKIQWAVLIKSFEFEKALMQEHFNENYMESSKYPKGVFKGSVKNYESIDFTKDGLYEAEVTGTLEIHGKLNTVETTASFKVENGKVTATSNFKIAVADYGIEIPSVVKDNIAKEVEVKINTNYELLEKS